MFFWFIVLWDPVFAAKILEYLITFDFIYLFGLSIAFFESDQFIFVRVFPLYEWEIKLIFQSPLPLSVPDLEKKPFPFFPFERVHLAIEGNGKDYDKIPRESEEIVILKQEKEEEGNWWQVNNHLFDVILLTSHQQHSKDIINDLLTILVYRLGWILGNNLQTWLCLYRFISDQQILKVIDKWWGTIRRIK